MVLRLINAINRGLCQLLRVFTEGVQVSICFTHALAGWNNEAAYPACRKKQLFGGTYQRQQASLIAVDCKACSVRSVACKAAASL